MLYIISFARSTTAVVAFDSRGRPFSVMGFTVRSGKIVEIDVLADPVRLRQLDLVSPTTDTEDGRQ